MIDIQYTDRIKVETKNISDYDINIPIKVEYVKHISKETQWTEELKDWMWASYPESEMFDVRITDSNHKELVYKKWNIIDNGSNLYKKIYFMIKSLGYKSKGLVIGSNDGETGEWIPLVLEDIVDVVLVEPTKSSFERLTKNYQNFNNVRFLNELITVDGKPTYFYEDGKGGYTNSVFKNVLENSYNLLTKDGEKFELDNIYEKKMESKTLNDVILNTMGNYIDWLHLDVEGLDADLIMSIDEKKLPKIIIFENVHLTEYKRKKLDNFLINKGYQMEQEEHVTIAKKI